MKARQLITVYTSPWTGGWEHYLPEVNIELKPDEEGKIALSNTVRETLTNLDKLPRVGTCCNQKATGGKLVGYLDFKCRHRGMHDPLHRSWNDVQDGLKNAGLWGHS